MHINSNEKENFASYFNILRKKIWKFKNYIWKFYLKIIFLSLFLINSTDG